MMEDVFVERRRANQIQRLNEDEFAALDSSTLDAANRIFSKLETNPFRIR